LPILRSRTTWHLQDSKKYFLQPNTEAPDPAELSFGPGCNVIAGALRYRQFTGSTGSLSSSAFGLKAATRASKLNPTVNKRTLSTGETGEFAPRGLGSASTLEVELGPLDAYVPNGDEGLPTKTFGMWRIRSTEHLIASVNKNKGTRYG
jgi:hypothetical protein